MSHKAVILCCAGPSLVDVDFRVPNLPLCAISTAIQVVADCAYWCFIDRPTNRYGHDRGADALANPSIIKLTRGRRQARTKRQSARNNLSHYPNVQCLRYNEAREDHGRAFLDGKPGILRTCGLSLPFAIQAMCLEGFDTLIFAGCDMHTDPENPYCYETHKVLPAREVNHKNMQHQKLAEQLREWTRIAADKGIRFLSMTPVSPINEYMEVTA